MGESPIVTFTPTEDQELIRSTARQFLDDRLGLPIVRDVMMTDVGFERGMWKEMADLGWTGLAISEEFGGAGYGLTEVSVLMEEMGRTVTPGPFLASSILATTAIQNAGTDVQQSEWLPGLASGETIGTIAFFEGPRDWSMSRIATEALPSGDGWVIDGVKGYVLDGHLADLMVVATRIGEEVGLFVIETEGRGVEINQTPVLDPTRRQAEVRLSDVRVGSQALLGGGPSPDAIRRTLSVGTTALASEQVGGAQQCLEMSVEYAKTRHQFGRPIGSFQAIKHRCAEMLMKVESAKSAAYHAARVADDQEEFTLASHLAGSVSSESYVWAAAETIQIHGGVGFTWEHDAHLYLKRAKASSLVLGDPRFHRDRLGRTLGI